MVPGRVVNWTSTVAKSRGEVHDLVFNHNTSSLVTLPHFNSVTTTIMGNSRNTGHSEYDLVVYILAFFALGVALLTDPYISLTDLAFNVKELVSRIFNGITKRLLKGRS